VTPPADPLIGETLVFPVTFDNTGTATGYGPFIDLVLPATGADGAGAAVDDGITFVSATYLGQPVTSVVLTFNGAGQATHPYAVNASGVPLVVTGGTPGDQLVVLQLPFGSFTTTQPSAALQVTTTLSNLADLGTPLNIRARAGFQYGADPLNNPPADPSIVGAFTANQPVTPAIWRLTKTYIGPEDETATGPNFPRQYRIDVDIATGQTVTNLDLIDLLPGNLQYLSVVSTLVNNAPAAATAVSTPSTTVPGGTLTRRFASVTGTAGTQDASLIFNYFVPRVDSGGAAVIDPSSGDDATSVNDASSAGAWTPIDPRDTASVITSNTTANDHTLTPKSLAIQKGVTIAIDTGAAGPTPGDTLEYTLSIQVSDFFAMQGLVLTDIISDGQRRAPGFVPTLAVAEHTGGNLPAAGMAPANSTFVVSGTTGETTATFFVAAEQVLRGLDGRLAGGCVPQTGTGGAAPDCTVFNGGATTVTVVYRTVIQEDFSNTFPSGDPSVDHGDVLSNAVTAEAAILSVTDAATPTGLDEADTSGAGVTILSGTLTKTIYAINGNTTVPNPARLGPGDTVTYRLRFTLPSSDVEPLTITDFLPLPVLLAGEVTGPFLDVVSAAVPAAGQAKFGPDDSFRALSGLVPTITVDAAGNSVRFDYPAFDDPGNNPTQVDILFTVTASNTPFADGLFLTNQARVLEGTTNAGQTIVDAIVQIILNEPNLRIRKGVVSSSNTADVYAPTTVGPVAFTTPGSAGNRFAGTISSNGLATSPINSNVSLNDASDLVTFAITVENIGEGPEGAFDVVIRDTLPAGLQIPGGGLNLRVTNGAGTVLPFTDLGGGLFGTGIQLVDPSLSQGAIAAFDATSGANIAILTFDLELVGSVSANAVITNVATLSNYAGTEGGPDFTTVDLTDPATVTAAPPTLTKVITGTNQAHTTGNNVAIGEQVSYRLTIRVPEGTTPAAVLTDTLDPGLAVVSLDNITASPALSAANGTFAGVLAAATVGASGGGAINAGRVITLNFGTLTNTDIDDATNETVVIDYTVVVLNATGNNRGGLRNNAASLAYTGGTAAASAPNVTILEPTLQVVKTALPTAGDADDVITFTVTLSHTGASNTTAFNTTLSDVLPAGLTYVSATHTGGLVPDTFTPGGGGFLAQWATFPLANTSTFQIVAVVNGGLSSGSVLTNTATATYTSLPGDVTTAQSTFNTLSTERTGNPADPGGAENDYVAAGSANVTVSAAAVAKALVSTNQPHTAGNNVAVGEILTYTVTVTVPEAVSNAVTLVDTLDPGLAFVGFDTLVVSNPAAVSTSVAGGFPAVLANATVSNPTASPETAGGRVTFNFGTVTNTDVNNTVAETLTLTYRAVVLNTAANLRGQARNNSVAWTAGSPAVVASAPDVTIVEPELQVVKTVAPANVDAGDSVTYTLVVSHTAASNADSFNAALLDTLPAGLTVTAGPTATGTAPTTLVLNAGAIEASWTSFPVGSTTTITFTATVSTALTPGTVVTNLSGISWTGLPGDVTTTLSPYNPLGVERTGNAGGPGGAANGYRASDPASVTINSNSLAGRVYVDADGNGLFTPGEAPIAGVVVTLTGTDHLGNAVTLTTTTLADGTYIFPNLRPGTYTVRESQPAGFADGGENAGSAGGTVGNDVVSAIVLPTGTVTDAVDYNFGERPTADLEVVKTDAPDPAQPGGTLVYTMLVRNNGPSAAANVVFRDPIPTGTAFVSIAAPGLSCTTPGVGAIGDVVCTVASLASGASTTVTLTLQVSPTLISGAVITNAAAVGSDTVDPRPENNRDDEPTVVAGPGTADLAIAKTDAVDPVVTGADVTYTLTIQNNGPTNATNVVVTDTLPAGVTLVSATPSQGAACTGTSTVSCDLGALANGASATVVVVVTTSAPGVIVNQAAVTASEPDPNPTNNQATEPTTVGNPTDADLVVTKVDAVDPVLTDAVIDYRIVVENRGPAAAASVTLADIVPANTVFEGLAAPAGWLCTAPAVGATGAISCTTASLAVGASAAIDVRVRVAPGTPPGTTVTNTVTVGSATPDPNPTNNTATEPTLVVAPGSADLSIIKTDAPDAQAAGAPVSYTLTVTNHGPATATSVTITDPLPSGTALIAASTGCSESGGILTCTIGTLAPGASTAVGVTISTPPVAGVLNNIATVTATEPDPVPGNNSEPEQTTLVSVADVRIAKVGPASATAGVRRSATP
jgi:large repetitive protein